MSTNGEHYWQTAPVKIAGQSTAQLNIVINKRSTGDLVLYGINESGSALAFIDLRGLNSFNTASFGKNVSVFDVSIEERTENKIEVNILFTFRNVLVSYPSFRLQLKPRGSYETMYLGNPSRNVVVHDLSLKIASIPP